MFKKISGLGKRSVSKALVLQKQEPECDSQSSVDMVGMVVCVLILVLGRQGQEGPRALWTDSLA